MPKISKTELIRLQKTLRTDAAIGEKFNITRQAVHQIRMKYGIPSIIPDNSARNAKIVALYKKGMSGIAIADKVGMSPNMIYQIINYGGAGKKTSPVKAPAKKAPAKKALLKKAPAPAAKKARGRPVVVIAIKKGSKTPRRAGR